jgi:hypothetical protein
MNKRFIPYEQASALKELGFKEACYSHYNPNGVLFWKLMCSSEDNDHTLSIDDILYHFAEGYIEAPSYEETFKWFRREHGYYSAIVPKKSYPDNFVSGLEWYVEICGGDGKEIGPEGTYSYGEAEFACLQQLIGIMNRK